MARGPEGPKSRKVKVTKSALTLQPLLFWKNARETPKKARVFSLHGTPKSLEKKGKTHKKAREIGKRKKQGNRRKQGLEGQGESEETFRVGLKMTNKMTRKWLKGCKKSLLVTLRVTFRPPSHFCAISFVTLRPTRKATFESLFRYFNYFWVSGLQARAPHHNLTQKTSFVNFWGGGGGVQIWRSQGKYCPWGPKASNQ